jgi:hypothetical protein
MMEYVKLGSLYYADPKIMRLSPDAECLFTRSLAFCGNAESAGFIELGTEIFFGARLKTTQAREESIAELVETGLWTTCEGGWEITRWAKWQDEVDYLSEKRKRDREYRREKRETEKLDRVDRQSYDLSTDSRTQPSTTVAPKERRGEERREEDYSKVGLSPDGPKKDHHPETDRLCRLLNDLIVANGNRPKQVTEKWRNSCDLLISKDKIPVTEIERLIRWSQKSKFWKSNIMSMPKFREKYDTLRMQSEEQFKKTGGGLNAVIARRGQAA